MSATAHRSAAADNAAAEMNPADLIGPVKACPKCSEMIAVNSNSCIFCGESVDFAAKAKRLAEQRRLIREEATLRRQMPIGGLGGTVAITFLGAFILVLSTLGIFSLGNGVGQTTLGSVVVGLFFGVTMLGYGVKSTFTCLRVGKALKSF